MKEAADLRGLRLNSAHIAMQQHLMIVVISVSKPFPSAASG